ncbi:hypothetical protein BH23CHL8_BH23CHL8_16630 [soil metagenome]
MALTFDDGWNRSACNRIAQALRSRRAKGTFFINGRYLAQKPKRWARILRGMPVGNHTHSHLDLVRQSDASIRNELLRNEAVHERLLGRPMLKLLRPPYGSHDTRVRQVAAGAGYRRVVLWNVDTSDWSPSATVSSVVARATGARAGSIILMHCARDVTVAALPAIIRHYRSRGIGLVGLGKLLRR